eukprot:CAMPEP_0195082784 /NCGR_PEP_ID=MMETSP0448-20130528/23894_1 /TAXON_ID=66468 /ORGANISM="Heterocapsa triquestra, Strain CCMP 448" /LENGTH=69 /DNA_ID=CAMNT_0040115925 /DNA_START=70 /DNA_END=275 /DNA_ORIENTATION=-
MAGGVAAPAPSVHSAFSGDTLHRPSPHMPAFAGAGTWPSPSAPSSCAASSRWGSRDGSADTAPGSGSPV